MSFKDTVGQVGTTLAVGAMVGTTAAPGMIAGSNLSDPVKESAYGLVENVHDAIESGVEGAAEAEDAANAEPVAEPESAIHTDPPPGVDVQAFQDSWTDTDAAAMTSDLSVYADADPALGAPVADPGPDAGPLGGVF